MFLPNSTTTTASNSSNKNKNKTKNVVLCKFFSQGYCKNGRNCKFLHIKEQTSEESKVEKDEQNIDDENSKNEQIATNDKISESNKDQVTHPVSQNTASKDTTESNQDNINKLTQETSKNIKNTEKILTKEEKKKIPCRYYSRGFCGRGKYCPYSHDKSVLNSQRRFKPKYKKQKDEATPFTNPEIQAIKLIDEQKKDSKIQYSEPKIINKNKIIIARPRTNEKTSDKDLRLIEIDLFMKKFPQAVKFNAPTAINDDNNNIIDNDLNNKKHNDGGDDDEYEDDDDAKINNDDTNDNSLHVNAAIQKPPSPLMSSSSSSSSSSLFKFIFTPSDPDWAFAVKDITMVVEFPTDYPRKAFSVVVTDNATIPAPVEKTLTKLINEWVMKNPPYLPRQMVDQSPSSPPQTSESLSQPSPQTSPPSLSLPPPPQSSQTSSPPSLSLPPPPESSLQTSPPSLSPPPPLESSLQTSPPSLSPPPPPESSPQTSPPSLPPPPPPQSSQSSQTPPSSPSLKIPPTYNQPLMFRPFLKWLDKSMEDLMTKALIRYKEDLQLAASGLQLISANELREIYKGAVPTDSTSTNSKAASKNVGIEMNVENSKATTTSNMATTANNNLPTTTFATSNTDLENTTTSLTNATTITTPKRGTEIRLNDLTITNIATMICTHIKAIVSCNRCTNQSEVGVSTTCQSNSTRILIGCLFCKQEGFAHYHANLVHVNDHRLCHFEMGGFQVVDIILARCQFLVTCFNCMKDNAVKSFFPGQHNDTWCTECHRKMTLKVNNVKVVRIGGDADPSSISMTTTSTSTTVARVETVSDQKRIKAVKDPAIQDGKPLPAFGTCRHFKKSFRWFRFPCCGKAYPCDHCHEDFESHDMKLANRMICGFCAYEQPFSPSNPCLRCGSHVTNKFTPHWEGGKGCRDKVKMSRTDSKKYANTQKTISSAAKEKSTNSTTAKSGIMVVKLRHS